MNNTCQMHYEELEQAINPRKDKLSDLWEYDKIIISISGGKDSVACTLYLLELGIPKDRLVLWHQDVDGGPDDVQFADWPVPSPVLPAAHTEVMICKTINAAKLYDQTVKNYAKQRGWT